MRDTVKTPLLIQSGKAAFDYAKETGCIISYERSFFEPMLP